MASSFLRFLDHTQWRTTVGRTPLDEWSARRRDLYLARHNTHNRQISMPPVGFDPTISAGERPQTYALDRAANETGFCRLIVQNNRYRLKLPKAVSYQISSEFCWRFLTYTETPFMEFYFFCTVLRNGIMRHKPTECTFFQINILIFDVFYMFRCRGFIFRKTVVYTGMV